MQAREFSLVLLGDKAVGKTTLMIRLLCGEFQKSWKSSSAVQTTSLRFETSCGPVIFHVRDYPGEGAVQGLPGIARS